MEKNNVKPTLDEKETLELQVLELEAALKYAEAKKDYKEGMIDGLKFAIRANGISGKDIE